MIGGFNKAALIAATFDKLAGKPLDPNGPFITESGRDYLKFDRIEIEMNKKFELFVHFYWKDLVIYTHDTGRNLLLEMENPVASTVSVNINVEGRSEISINAG